MKVTFNQRIRRFTITLTATELGHISAILQLASEELPEPISEEAQSTVKKLLKGTRI